PGNLSPAQITGALNDPEDPVVVLPLPGTVIRQALEVAVSRYPVKQKSFLQVSGMTFAFDPSRDANRVVAVSIGGQPLQDGRTYRVAMSSSLAAGAHGYIRLWNRDREAAEKGITLAAAVQNYLRDRTPLT